MNVYPEIQKSPETESLDLFNEAAATIARPDFPALEIEKRLRPVEIVRELASRNEIYSAPGIGLLTRVMNDRSAGIRECIVHAVGCAGGYYGDVAADSLTNLACLRDDESDRVRRAVAEEVGTIGAKYEDQAAHALDLLDVLKSDDNVIVRRWAANSIGRIGICGPVQAQIAQEMLLEMMPDNDDRLNNEIAMRLAEIGNVAARNFEDPPPFRGPEIK